MYICKHVRMYMCIHVYMYICIRVYISATTAQIPAVSCVWGPSGSLMPEPWILMLIGSCFTMILQNLWMEVMLGQEVCRPRMKALLQTPTFSVKRSWSRMLIWELDPFGWHSLFECGHIPEERPALPPPPGHISAGGMQIPMPLSKPCLRCSPDKYLKMHATEKLLCASSMAGGLGRLAGNGSGIKGRSLITCTPSAVIIPDAWNGSFSWNSRAWACLRTISLTSTAALPGAVAACSPFAGCTIFCNSFLRLAGNSTGNGIALLLQSEHRLPEPAEWVAQLVRTRMWRRWRFRQSVPKRFRKRRSGRTCPIGHRGLLGSTNIFLCSSCNNCSPRNYKHTNYQTAPASQMCTRPGPKSRRGACVRPAAAGKSGRATFSLLTFLATFQSSTGVRVGSAPIAEPGVFVTKSNEDTRNVNLFGPFCMTSPPNFSAVRKRSFRRAIRRAQQSETSSTMYRGRRMILRSASTANGIEPREGGPPQHRLVRAPASRGPRLRVCSYNVRGLDTAAFDLLMNWLHRCPYDIVVLQEIHHGMGRDSNQWTSKGWRLLTSVDPACRFQGIAVILRTWLAPEYDIRFHEIQLGRLMHVRVDLRQTALDIVGVYQYAWTMDSSKQVLDKRLLLWNRMSAYLSSLPVRNQLLIIGDFNCSLLHVAGGTGAGRMPHPTKLPDAGPLCTQRMAV